MLSGRKDYADIALSIVPRMISSLDRNMCSPTYGCFDKAYWFYKTSDFPSARLQEPLLTFALLYKNRFPGNHLYRNDVMLKFSLAALNFLKHIQNSDGSFNEWYPNERSFCATTFSAYASSESIKVLGPKFVKTDEYMDMLRKSGRFLLRHDTEVSNQESGAAAALYNIYMLTGEKRFRAGAEDKVKFLKSIQSKEGWLPEYGGPDPGYLTVSLDFLGKYYKESRSKNALSLAIKSLEFLKYMINPDGSLGGSVGSRNTEFFLPHGIEIISGNPDAKIIADRLAKDIKTRLNPSMMDDRYAFVYNQSYLQAFLEYRQRLPVFQSLEHVKTFPDSGIHVYDKKYRFIVNMRKGGVFKVFSKGRCIYEDSGLVGVSKGKIMVTQWNNSSDYSIGERKIIVKGTFKKLYSRQTLTPGRNIMLRTFLTTLGRFDAAAPTLKGFLRKKMILHAKDTKIRFTRTFELFDDKVEVTDRFEKPGNIKFCELRIPTWLSAAYVPTSSFYSTTEIHASDGNNYAESFNEGKLIKRVIKCD